jgi:hypothetical protein
VPQPRDPRRPAASPTESDEQRRQRRDALARKLGRATSGSIPPPSGPAVGVPPSSPRGSWPGIMPPAAGGAPAGDLQQSAAEVLRDRFDRLGDEVRRKRMQRYVTRGEQAIAAGDYRTAAAAFAQAARLDPSDRDLAARAAEAASRAAGT